MITMWQWSSDAENAAYHRIKYIWKCLITQQLAIVSKKNVFHNPQTFDF